MILKQVQDDNIKSMPQEQKYFSVIRLDLSVIYLQNLLMRFRAHLRILSSQMFCFMWWMLRIQRLMKRYKWWILSSIRFMRSNHVFTCVIRLISFLQKGKKNFSHLSKI